MFCRLSHCVAPIANAIVTMAPGIWRQGLSAASTSDALTATSMLGQCHWGA